MKILTVRAHCGHQYELWKLGHEIHVATNFNHPLDNWIYSQRPLPENATLIDHRKINPDDYDFAIIHFDENMLRPGHRGTPENWGVPFNWVMENTKNIPRAAICHGTPQFEEQGDITKETLHVNVYKDRQQKMVDYMKDTLVICNSNQAREEWGFHKSKTIWHGFDPNKFVKGSNMLGVLSPSVAALKQRPHYRGWYIQKNIMANLPRNLPVSYTGVVDPAQTPDPNIYAEKKFDIYIRTIGKYSIYLNTTWRSPMPRSRGEAMMCGLISINCNTHDAGMFIENGVNGFISNDPKEIINFIIWLSKKPEQKNKISLASRNTAISKFNINRFLSEWGQTINDVIRGKH